MDHSETTFEKWRASLAQIHDWFLRAKASTNHFALKAFAVFAALNFTCYWWAILTAKADMFFGSKFLEYSLLSLPVALLGGLFDIFSLGITLWAVSRALKTTRNHHYLAFLGIDLIIAVVATFWVLFVFIFSGWLIGYVLPVGETLGDRAGLYQDRVSQAINHPLARESIKNIYFGVIMGASALLPTLIHASLALWAGLRSVGRAVKTLGR